MSALISFDGLDSSGKETQTKRLVTRLESIGKTVRCLATPDYTSATGQQLKQLLQNKDGSWEKLSWEAKMKLFAANRAEHKAEVEATLAKGGFVVYDRYIPSSLAFFAAESASREQAHALITQHEYDENQMPHESVSIFLDVPPLLAHKLLDARKQLTHDEAEYTDQLVIQQKLYDEYKYLAEQEPERFLHVQCISGDTLDSIETIHERLWTALQARLPTLQ